MLKTLHIEYTTRCNSRCVMCDYWKRQSHDDVDNALLYDSVAQLYAGGLKTIYFSGGECLVQAKNVFSLCRQLKEDFPNLVLKLNTNGILLMDYVWEISSLFSTVVVSLDTADRKVYQAIRGVDALDRVKDGISCLREISPKTNMNLRALVLAENIGHLQGLIDYAISSGVNKLSFIPEDVSSAAFSRGKDYPAMVHHSSAMVPEIEQLLQLIQTKYAKWIDGPLSRSVADLKYISRIYSHECCKEVHCDKYCNSCVLAANGLVSPCFFIPGSQRISENKSILKILESAEYMSTVDAIREGQGEAFCLNCACPKILS